MVITAEERRSTLALFNISEAARRLDIPVQVMHRAVRAGDLPKPQVKLGQRRYYAQKDMAILAKRVAKCRTTRDAVSRVAAEFH